MVEEKPEKIEKVGKPMGVIGGCMPPFPLSIFEGLKEIEGYVIFESKDGIGAAAIFKGKIKDGGVQIPQHIRKALKEDVEVTLAIIQSHKKKEG